MMGLLVVFGELASIRLIADVARSLLRLRRGVGQPDVGLAALRFVSSWTQSECS